MKKLIAVSVARKKLKTKSSNLSLKMILLFGLFFLICAGLSYGLFFWSGWQVKKVEVKLDPEVKIEADKISQIIEDELSAKYYLIIPKNNIWLVPIENIKQSLLEAFPQISKIEIKQKIDFTGKAANILNIVTQRREEYAIWCQAKIKHQEALPETKTSTSTQPLVSTNVTLENSQIINCYFADQEGVIFKEAPQTQGDLIFSIYDYTKDNVDLGDHVVAKDQLDKLAVFIQELPHILSAESIADRPRLEYFSLVNIGDIRAMTSFGWQIYFDSWRPLEEQLIVLKRALIEQIKDLRSIVEYVDLRTKNRVYYR